jgi:hypothetical protein
MRLSRLAFAAAAALLWLGTSLAGAYDTGPHADLTRDALTSEGFGSAAADVGMVDNWFVDYYTNPGKNPYSGHASWTIGLTRLGLPRESWPNHWVEGARRMHFDSEFRAAEMPNLSRTAGIEQEWQRLMFLTQKWARYAGRNEDPLLLMAVLGISLHSVQDFYTHSNWVEDPSPEDGRGGPGVAALGYGSHPTWFDVPPEVRATFVGNRAVYTGVIGVPRGHSHWREDLNRSLYHGLNKDWPGRPKYAQSYVTAYFASRQWIRAVRTWLGNEPLWQRARALPGTAALRHDVEGATEISRFSGHWQGGGEPCLRYFGSCGVRNGKAGSLSSLKLAIDEFHLGGPTRYRRAFNKMIGAFAEYPVPPPVMPDLPSSRTDQLLTRFVKLEVLDYAGLGLGDPVGEADIYANARVRGQAYTSTIINDADSFAFPRARLVRVPVFGDVTVGGYHAFTWIRSVPVANAESTPVTTMTVRVETGDRRYAGTDDDVYLRINGRQRFNLDKAAYDDFERGDDDTYSVPIGEATRGGLTVGDIDRVAIEKSRDGVAGGWLLKGVTVIVNGRVLVRERAINRWLEDDRRAWSSTGLVRDQRTSDVVPVWMQLREDDFGPQDDGDINRYDRVGSQAIAYRPGPPVERRLVGGALLRGRLPLGNGDRARLTYRLSTLAVVAPPPPVRPAPPVTTPPPLPPDTTPPPPGPKPNLVITALDTRTVTVMNTGAAAAGPFNVTVVDWGLVRAPGLAAGASTTLLFYNGTSCGGDYRAFADSQNEVVEVNELDNTRENLGVIC